MDRRRLPISVQFLMSVTSAPQPRTVPSSPEAIKRWFQKHIWHNREVCSNCFSRLAESSTTTYNSWGDTATEYWPTDSATRGFDHDDPPESIASVVPLARERLTCDNCGSVGGKAIDATLSKQAALERAPVLADRLREMGYRVDQENIESTIYHLKTGNDYRDRHVFAVAAAYGVGL